MEARAIARFQRISPRKARVVVDMVRGRNAAEALDLLRYTPKYAAKSISKLLDSAVANARDKDESIDIDSLFIKTAFVDKAPDRNMRRWRPRAMGRATQIVKGMSHITIVLEQRAEA